MRRGDADVVRRAAGNAGAQFSQTGYSELIKRAGKDGVLTLKVGQRDDLSDLQLKDLLAGSIDILRRRLFEVVKPGPQVAIKQAMSEISGVPEKVESRRDFVPGTAQGDGAASRRRIERTRAAWLCQEPQIRRVGCRFIRDVGREIATLDRLSSGDRHDPVLILGKAIGLEWVTVRALVLLRLGPTRVPSPTDIENVRTNFVRLMPLTAERVVNFWQTRQSRDFQIAIKSADPSKSQIGGAPAFAFGFAAVARHRVPGPGQAPVIGSLRSPDEIRRARKMRQRPCAIIADIADEAKFAAGPQHACHRGDGCVLHETPFPVPSFRPWVGMDQVDGRQRFVAAPMPGNSAASPANSLTLPTAWASICARILAMPLT